MFRNIIFVLMYRRHKLLELIKYSCFSDYTAIINLYPKSINIKTTEILKIADNSFRKYMRSN
jgi:hypothetical protein